jgi:hypothetical protein
MFDITVNANSMTTEIDLLDPNAVTLGSSTGSSPFNLTGSVNITDPMSFAQYEVPASFTRFAVFVQGEPDIGQRINSVSSTSFTVTYDYTPAATPLPAALPLFATGLGALGLLGWRRKRKDVIPRSTLIPN